MTQKKMSRTKTCTNCKKDESVMYRVQYKPGKVWCFLCKECMIQVRKDNVYYRYGGTWKG